jgi:Protein of unknown function (DUF2721)
MSRSVAELSLLSAMITPTVLISAAGLLILSTSNRLARIVDRTRALGTALEARTPVPTERGVEMERQLALYARRGRLIQIALASFYVSLSLFVAATISIGLVALLPVSAWLPTALGIAGTLVLFYGCVMLIGETRLALRSVGSEMAKIATRAPRLIASPSSAQSHG